MHSNLTNSADALKFVISAMSVCSIVSDHRLTMHVEVHCPMLLAGSWRALTFRIGKALSMFFEQEKLAIFISEAYGRMSSKSQDLTMHREKP